MKKLNTKGFSFIEGLLIFVIVGLIAGVGYYVFNARKDNNATNQATGSNSTETEESPKQVQSNNGRFTSGKGSFSIVLADGLKGLSDTTGNFFVFDTYTSNVGTAKLTNIDGYGSDGFKAVTIVQDDSNNSLEIEKSIVKTQESFETSSGLKGIKITYTDPYKPPCDGLGCYLGDKHVIYEFTSSDSDKVTRVFYSRRVINEESKRVYGISKEDPDFTSEIDAMVKTLQIN